MSYFVSIANLIGFNASFKITFNVSDFHRFMILYSTSYTFNCLISVSIDKTELVGNRLFTYLRSHLHIYECKKKRKIGYLYINLCYYAHRTYRKLIRINVYLISQCRVFRYTYFSVFVIYH